MTVRAVFLDAEGLEDCDLAALRQLCDGGLQLHPGTDGDQILERISGAKVVIVNKVRLGRDVLVAAPDVKLICVVATGTDCIDLQAATEAGVTVCNCQAYGTDSVVQHVFAGLLALQTNLLRYREAVERGRWQQARQFCFLDYPIVELRGKTLGIVGYGNLGRGVAAVAEAFGMRVMVAARPGCPDDARPSLDELLPQLDVLTLHCPLNQHTRGLIGRGELARMKSSAIVINVARGGIVDEEDLVEALREGRIGGAFVDVLTSEPPRSGNPLLAADLPNLLVTPHIAWASREARQRIIDQTVANIESWQAGKAVRVVTG